MTMKLKEAVEEAREFLGAHERFAGSREVRCVTPFSEDLPSLTLDAVRALFALGADVQGICDEYGPELAGARQ